MNCISSALDITIFNDSVSISDLALGLKWWSVGKWSLFTGGLYIEIAYITVHDGRNLKW